MHTRRLQTVKPMIALLLCGLAMTATAQPQPPTYDSPKAVFDAAQKSFNNQAWDKFIQCVSPKARSRVIAGIGIGVTMLHRMDTGNAEAAQLVETYLPKDIDPATLTGQDEETQARLDAFAAEIKKPEEFFAKAMVLLFKTQESEARITGLNNLAVAEDGQTATGDVVISQGESGKETTDAWGFQKIGDGWFVTMTEKAETVETEEAVEAGEE